METFDHVRHEAYAQSLRGASLRHGAVVNGIAISSKDSSRDMVALVNIMSPNLREDCYVTLLESGKEDLNEPWFGDGHSVVVKFSPDQKVRW